MKPQKPGSLDPATVDSGAPREQPLAAAPPHLHAARDGGGPRAEPPLGRPPVLPLASLSSSGATRHRELAPGVSTSNLPSYWYACKLAGAATPCGVSGSLFRPDGEYGAGCLGNVFAMRRLALAPYAPCGALQTDVSPEITVWEASSEAVVSPSPGRRRRLPPPLHPLASLPAAGPCRTADPTACRASCGWPWPWPCAWL